jgi:hypothetical protein
MNHLRNSVAFVAVALSALANSEARAEDAAGPIAPVASVGIVPTVTMASPEPPATHVHSKADIAVGSALMGLGVAHIVPGIYLLGHHDHGVIEVNGFAGAMFVGFGIAHVVPGVVLVAVGASPVTEKPTPGVRAELQVEPAGADFALRF